MAQTRLTAVLLAAVVLGGLVIRLMDLERRPMHNDEANQAYRAGILMETGEYRYDPVEHHGPTLYYLVLPQAWAAARGRFSETSVWTYRIVPALFGVALIAAVALLWDGLGRAAAVCAAVLTAVSPAMVYYSRFYIQEMLLLFFTFAAIGCGWRYLRTRHWGWIVGCGISLGLMHATKETAVIAWVSMGAAVLLLAVAEWDQAEALVAGLRRRHVLYLLGAAAVTSIIWYSSFGTNWHGPIDSVLTYVTYLKRAGTDPDHIHANPLWYLHMLVGIRYGPGPVWTEAFILILAAVGALVTFAEHLPKGTDGHLARFLVWYSLFVMTLYSVISYKTPWCLLTFHHGFILLAGIGAWWLVRWRRHWAWRTGMGMLLLSGCVHLTREAWSATHRYDSDPRNPYVYAQTSRDFLKLEKRMSDLAAVAEEGHDMLVHVVTRQEETWPIPFSLRAFTQVGYWHDPASYPSDPGTPLVVITSLDFEETATERVGGNYLHEYYGLRRDVMLSLWIRRDLWNAFMETRQ